MPHVTQLLTASEADDALSPHREALGSSIHNGWQRWRDLIEDNPDLAFIVSSRSRAGLVYDFIRHEALKAFHGVPEVQVSEERSFLLLTFNEKIVLRFKKFRDKSMRTASSPTKQAQEYANQVLPGMEALTHLVAGYLPDELGLKLDKTAITCMQGSDLLWVIELDLGIDDGSIAAPVKPLTPASPQAGTIIRPRRPDGLEGIPGQAFSEER